MSKHAKKTKPIPRLKNKRGAKPKSRGRKKR